jgi:hypothetical protein
MTASNQQWADILLSAFILFSRWSKIAIKKKKKDNKTKKG